MHNIKLFLLLLYFLALVVRYLTRRYIGDYDAELERVYTHTCSVDNELMCFEILDSASHSRVS